MDLATVLDDCVRRMRRGESVEDCLAVYPEQAADLAPMLRAASALEWLAGLHLPDAHRQQTRAALRRAAATRQAMPKRPVWMALGVRPAARAFAGVAAVLVFLTFAISTVAASRPGDLAYPARLMAERSTVLLQRTPGGQASASLRLANNRLSDLEAGLALPGRAYDPALNALLEEDKGLADLTPHMLPATREQIARQVAGHAGQLEKLAQRDYDPQVADALRRAAGETNALAETILAHNDKTTPALGDPTAIPQTTPAAKRLATTAPVVGVPTLGASVHSQSATAAPSVGTPETVTGPAAGSTVAPPASVVPTNSPVRNAWGRSKHGGPQAGPLEKVLPPASGKGSTDRPTSPPTPPAPLSPDPTATSARQSMATPAPPGKGNGSPGLQPPGRAARGLTEGPAGLAIGKGPAAWPKVLESKQKGGTGNRPTPPVHSIER